VPTHKKPAKPLAQQKHLNKRKLKLPDLVMTIHIIILYIVCFGLVVWQFFAIRQEQRQFEAFDHLRERCAENGKAYLRLEARVSLLEKEGK
jgi:cytoskeletal protein RodZ